MNTDRQILNIEARLKDLRHDLANDLRHNAKHRIGVIKSLLSEISQAIEIQYVVSGLSSNCVVYLDNVIDIKKHLPLAFEFNPVSNFTYRWPGVVQEVDQLNNSILLKYPLPEVPAVGSIVRVCGDALDWKFY